MAFLTRPAFCHCLAWAALSGSVHAQAHTAGQLEYEVKAAFLYNFAKFAEWPGEKAGDAFIVGTLGQTPLGDVLEEISRGKTINGRRLLVRRFARWEAAGDCHILFISASEARRQPEILDALRGKSVLTVGENEGFADAGGVINFVVEEGKVRFEVNVEAARRAKLKISSQLLKLARLVRDPTAGRRP